LQAAGWLLSPAAGWAGWLQASPRRDFLFGMPNGRRKRP